MVLVPLYSVKYQQCWLVYVKIREMTFILSFDQEAGKSVTCVIHLSPASVVSSSYYQKWMKKFGFAQHIMAGHEKKNVEIPILKASARIASRLNYVYPQFFPAPGFNQNMMIEEPWLCDSTVPSCLENIRRDDLEIILLGTGSSQPSKYRNVSSIYINLFSKIGLLLDCGEGTLGQLKRRYGTSGVDDVVRALRCIWISHIYADHHTDLARILALCRELLKAVPHEPVIVVGPRQLKRYLDAYQRLEDLDMLFLDCKHTTSASLDAFEDGCDLNNNNRLRGLIETGDSEQIFQKITYSVPFAVTAELTADSGGGQGLVI
nr:tRNAse Z TRZ4, mitochondrial-like [Arachis hypogaea]